MSVTKKELAHNASRWLDLAKREGLAKLGVGGIFVFFNLDDLQSSGVVTGTVEPRAVIAALKGVIAKIERETGTSSVIIDPYGRQ